MIVPNTDKYTLQGCYRVWHHERRRQGDKAIYFLLSDGILNSQAFAFPVANHILMVHQSAVDPNRGRLSLVS